MRYYDTEEKVKKLLGVKDFRSVNKKQLIRFVSNLHRMNKDVAIACANQFPKFSDFAETSLGYLYNLCDKAIGNNRKEIIEQYKERLHMMNEMYAQAETPFDRNLLIEEIHFTECQLSAEHDKQNMHTLNVIRSFALAAAGAIAVVGSAIGVSSAITNPGLPNNPGNSNKI